MRTHIIIYLAVVILAGLNSCKDAITSEDALNKTEIGRLDDGRFSIFPLAVGNTWLYRESFIRRTKTQLMDSITMVVSRDTAINGQRWYLITSFGTSFPIMVLRDSLISSDGWWYEYLAFGDWWMTNRNDGLYHQIIVGGVVYPEQLCYKYPAFKGTIYSSGSDFVIVQSADTSITVPAGTFRCMFYQTRVYSGKDTLHIFNEFCCPGKGRIKTEYAEYTQDGSQELFKSVLELLSCKLH